jgi:uncharacterized protein
MHPKTMSVIIRTTEKCNFGCKYCYVKPSSDDRLFPLHLFEKLVEGLAEEGYGRVLLYWHGGEPLLAGLDYYRTAVQIEKGVVEKYDNVTIENKIQTNGSLVTQEWVDFFGENEFGVGLSLDGEQTMNDRNRVYRNGQSTFSDVMRGLALMQEAGFKTNILSVLTRNHIDRLDSHYAFVKDLKLKTFKVNPCVVNKCENSELQVHPQEWGQAMMHLFDLWFFDENPPHNREFEFLIQSLFMGWHMFCTNNKTCFKNFMSVVPSGEMFPCAKLIDDSGRFGLGNIASGISSVMHNHKKLSRNYDGLGCDKCKWERLCYGGCTGYAYWAHGDINTRDYLCEGYKMLFQHVYDRVRAQIWKGTARRPKTTLQEALQ